MIIVIDFDGTVVEYDSDPPTLAPFVREALAALKLAGHTLILQSSRACLASRLNPFLHPLARAEGADEIDVEWWDAHERPEAERRYQDMLDFVARELPGAFDAIDDGVCGKIPADLYLDDRGVRIGHRGQLYALDWRAVAQRYGEFENP